MKRYNNEYSDTVIWIQWYSEIDRVIQSYSDIDTVIQWYEYSHTIQYWIQSYSDIDTMIYIQLYNTTIQYTTEYYTIYTLPTILVRTSACIQTRSHVDSHHITLRCRHCTSCGRISWLCKLERVRLATLEHNGDTKGVSESTLDYRSQGWIIIIHPG